MRTDWENLNKIRIRELTDAQTKHLIVKTLLVQQILIKYKKTKYMRVYTEFPIRGNKICDVYFENFKTKEAYAYEIQKDVSKKWLIETEEAYKDWEVPFMKTANWILIDLNELSDELEELIKQIKKIVV